MGNDAELQSRKAYEINQWVRFSCLCHSQCEGVRWLVTSLPTTCSLCLVLQLQRVRLLNICLLIEAKIFGQVYSGTLLVSTSVSTVRSSQPLTIRFSV